MSALEKVWHQPLAPFEQGIKTRGDVFLRSVVVQGRPNATTLVSTLSQPFWSDEIRNFKLKVDQSTEGSSGLDKEAWQLLRKNLFFLPNSLSLRAGPVYPDKWFRDMFTGCLFMNDPVLEGHLLNQAIQESHLGQIPTVTLFPGRRSWFFDDEVQMEALIWRAKLKRSGMDFEEDEKDFWKTLWENQILSKVVEGIPGTRYFMTEPGNMKSWFDTFKFNPLERGVLSHLQGIFAASALAADFLEVNCDPKASKEAASGYARLADRTGYIPLSNKHKHKDTSALFGEFVAQSLFDQSLLPSYVVIDTYTALYQTDLGTPVVVTSDNKFLPPSDFSEATAQGDYQNGAQWPGYSAASRAAAEKHGLSHDRHFWNRTLHRTRVTGNAEFSYTNPNIISKLGSNHDPKKEEHLLNTLVYFAAKTAGFNQTD